MKLRQPSTRLGVPGEVQDLRVSANGQEGILQARWKRERGAVCYQLASSREPVTATSWASRGTVTKPRAALNSFASGSRVWLRVRTRGAAGEGPWSEPVACRVP